MTSNISSKLNLRFSLSTIEPFISGTWKSLLSNYLLPIPSNTALDLAQKPLILSHAYTHMTFRIQLVARFKILFLIEYSRSFISGIWKTLCWNYLLEIASITRRLSLIKINSTSPHKFLTGSTNSRFLCIYECAPLFSAHCLCNFYIITSHSIIDAHMYASLNLISQLFCWCELENV